MTLLGFIVALHFACEINSEADIYYNNGWIPITNEKALGHVHRNLTKTPGSPFFASWNPIQQSKEHDMHFKGNSNLKPQYININLMKERHFDSINIDEKENEEHKDYWLEPDNRDAYMHTAVNNEDKNIPPGRHREAKKILEDILLDNNKRFDKNMITIKVDGSKINHPLNGNTYEVTEPSDVGEVLYNPESDKISNISPTLATGIISTSSTKEENLANKLFAVLGNYNIRTNDDLTNYAISRKKNGPKLFQQSYGYPVQLKYNSQNHFPIDPLLAVFLSNYGYYLSGVYGFPGHYDNIYGYLAANNIHNNKPFGAYKIYSDTDSSQ